MLDVGRASLKFARGSVSATLFSVGALLLLGAMLVGTSALSFGHLAGSLFASIGLVGIAAEGRLGTLTARPSRGVFVGLFAIVAAGHALTAWAYYWSGEFAVFDIGIFADLVANFALRGSYRSSILGVHGFADHFTPSMMLLAPLFLWKPTFLWLIGAKIVAALACPPLLYLIGREVLGKASPWLWAIPCLCLAHTVFLFAYLFQFQPTHLAPPLALFCFWLALRERWFVLTLSLLVLAGLKEDQALVGVCVGMFLIVERQRPRIGAAIVLASVVVGLVIFTLLMPAFSEGAPVLQHSRFGPFALWPEKLLLVAAILASVGGLPLLHPRSALWIGGAFGAHLSSSFSRMLDFRYHYHAVLVAISCVGAIYGLAAIQNDTGVWKRLGPKQRAFGAAGALGAVLSLNGMLPHFSARKYWPTAETRAVIEEIDELLRRLPEDRAIYASGTLIAHLVPARDLHTLRGNDPALAHPFLGQPPHVVIVPTVPLIDETEAWCRDRLAALDRVAATGGYRVESPSPHLRLYWSPDRSAASHAPLAP